MNGAFVADASVRVSCGAEEDAMVRAQRGVVVAMPLNPDTESNESRLPSFGPVESDERRNVPPITSSIASGVWSPPIATPFGFTVNWPLPTSKSMPAPVPPPGYTERRWFTVTSAFVFIESAAIDEVAKVDGEDVAR